MPKAQPELLSRPEDVRELARKLSTEPRLAFDTEFIRESSFYPRIELIQIGTREEVFLLDACALKKQGVEAIQPVLDLFTSQKILKIGHALQADQECLYTSFGVTAKPSLDTAVIGSLLGLGESVGLQTLLREALGVQIKKGHARTDWSTRPIPAQMLEYARNDVRYLIEAVEKLLPQLEELGRKDWAIELSSKWEDSVLYEPDPEGLARKFAQGARFDSLEYTVFLGLVRWREAKVRKLDVPRKWLADDQVLADLSRVRPKDIKQMSTFRGISSGIVKKHGEELLSIIRAAEKSDRVRLPRSIRGEQASAEETRVIALLNCFLSKLTEELKLSPKLIFNNAGALGFLRAIREEAFGKGSSEQKILEHLVETGVFSDLAGELVGRDLIRFAQGKKSLRVVDGAVSVEDLG